MRIKSAGVLLTLREIDLILHTHPKGHPVRKMALRDIATYRRYATACGKQAVALWKQRNS